MEGNSPIMTVERGAKYLKIVPPSKDMYFVYILKNRGTNRLYIGYTNNLQRRLTEHKEKDNRLELIYYETYTDEKLAREREKRLKYYGSAWRGLKKRLGLC